MNKEQKYLVNFIMSLDNEQFDMWADKATMEEIFLATEAIKLARMENEKKLEYVIEDELQNLSDAREVLGQFTLNGLQ